MQNIMLDRQNKDLLKKVIVSDYVKGHYVGGIITGSHLATVQLILIKQI